MKKLIFIALMVMALATHGSLFAQSNNAGNPQPEKSQNFFEIQKSFHDYWAPYKVQDGWYIDENGERVKAAGWKQAWPSYSRFPEVLTPAGMTNWRSLVTQIQPVKIPTWFLMHRRMVLWK